VKNPTVERRFDLHRCLDVDRRIDLARLMSPWWWSRQQAAKFLANGEERRPALVKIL